MSSADRSAEQLDRLVAEAAVIITVGAGGVGKTTMAAALGALAAERGRRVLVVTVDPARRLADALGVTDLPEEPVLVPVGDEGRLWVSMVDMARSWDELVAKVSPDAATRDALVANGLYRALTTRFIQSHDYIALDHLCDLTDIDRYDLVVIDTPPSTHAIDVLDAPDRMTAFFDSRLLRWLTAPYRSRVAQATARPFLAVAERLLGGPFLAQIAEFFWLFSRLQPGFVGRAGRVRARLDADDTAYVVVTTAEPSAIDQTDQLLDALALRRHHPRLIIHNRASPLSEERDRDEAVTAVADPSLAAAMTSLVIGDGRVGRALAGRSGPVPAVVRVPWRVGELGTARQLAALLTLRSW
ncbi:MAG: ArsA family ATPase [Acidimicrobiales bacterium]